MRYAAALLALLASCAGPTRWALVDASVVAPDLQDREWRVKAFGSGFMAEALRDVDGRADRVIVVSDGDGAGEGVEAEVRRLRGEGATVSSICLGTPTMDAAFMSRIAERGGGRFYFTTRPKDVPRILKEEAGR